MRQYQSVELTQFQYLKPVDKFRKKEAFNLNDLCSTAIFYQNSTNFFTLILLDDRNKIAASWVSNSNTSLPIKSKSMNVKQFEGILFKHKPKVMYINSGHYITNYLTSSPSIKIFNIAGSLDCTLNDIKVKAKLEQQQQQQQQYLTTNSNTLTFSQLRELDPTLTQAEYRKYIKA